MRLGRWVMLLRGLLSRHEMPSLTVDGCDSKGEGCGERKQKRQGGVAGLCGLSRLVGVLSSILSYCVHLVPFWNECLISSVPLCV